MRVVLDNQLDNYMHRIKEVVLEFLRELETGEMSYTVLADIVLERHENIGMSHRTLRRKLSEEFKSLKTELGNKKQWVREEPKRFEWKSLGQVVQQAEIQMSMYTPTPQRETFKLISISDLHGVYLDEECFELALDVFEDNVPDELVINGDAIDLPFLSKHHQKLIKAGVLRDYSEIGELEFTREKILEPLRRRLPRTKIVYRLGNHDERITNPFELTQAQLKRLAVVYEHYQTTKLDEMLGLRELSIEYDPTPVRNYFGVFDLIHGLSLAKNAPERNILDRMSSGSSGHSHRGNVTYISKGGKHYAWSESGHMRTDDVVEYFPTAVLPNWCKGFNSTTFDLTHQTPLFFTKFNPIIQGVCEFNGKIYR